MSPPTEMKAGSASAMACTSARRTGGLAALVFVGSVKRVSPYTMKRNGIPTCECNSTGCVCANNNGAGNINSTNTRDFENDTVNSLDVWPILCARVLLPWYGSLFVAQVLPLRIHLDFGALALREDRGFVSHQFFMLGDRLDGDNLPFSGLGAQCILNISR